jgi:hypothetical protein
VTAEQLLESALDNAPGQVRFWWRDDDAGADRAQLAALLALADRRRAPVALAVVPDWLEAACMERIHLCGIASVLQHGMAHSNHAVAPAKKVELGGGAERPPLFSGLEQRRLRLRHLFGDKFAPVLVPPWNRIANDIVDALPSLGFAGLSTFGPRRSALAPPRLHWINTHLDLIVWRGQCRPLGVEEAIRTLARLVQTVSGEPIGILSHHAVMDAGAIATLDRLLRLVQDHPRATLATAASLFMEGR